MNGHGGSRPGSGRPKGVKPDAPAEWLTTDGLSPLETLLTIMRNPEAPLKLRFLAAKEAAPYMHPKMSPVAVDAVTEPKMSPEEAAWDADLGMRPN